MNSLKASEARVVAEAVEISDAFLTVNLSDGRIVSVPLNWYPRLHEGSPGERQAFQLIGKGLGIHWSLLDEDISVESLLRGGGSMESAASLERWRAHRRQE
jgi:hypothetical protein